MEPGQAEWLDRHARKTTELTTDQRATLGKIVDGIPLMNHKSDTPRAPEASDICSLCGEPAKNHGNFGFRDHAFRDVAGKRWDIDWSFPSSAASPGAAPLYSREEFERDRHGATGDAYREAGAAPSGEGERHDKAYQRILSDIAAGEAKASRAELLSRLRQRGENFRVMMDDLAYKDEQIEALRAEVASLTAQLAERDATIARLTHKLLRPSRIVHPQRSQVTLRATKGD